MGSKCEMLHALVKMAVLFAASKVGPNMLIDHVQITDVLSFNRLVTVVIYFVGVFCPLHIKLKLLF